MKTILKSNQGIALVIVIMTMVLLLSATGAALLLSGLNLKTAGSKTSGDKSLHVADYAIHHALGVIPWGLEFDNVLGGTVTEFPLDSGVPTLTGSFSGYAYTVTAENDPPESGAPTDDSNQIIVLTATATHSDGSKRSIQAYVGRPTSTWRPPGAVYIGAPDGTSGFSGSSFEISGKDTNPGEAEGSGPEADLPGIATKGSTRKDNDVAALGSSRYSKVDGSGASPSIQITGGFDVAQMAQDLIDLYSADKINVCPGTYTNETWGTEAAPKIIFFPGAPDCADGTTTITGNSSGYGVMILDRDNNLNDLHVAGTFEWNGLIITRGGGTGLGGHIHHDPGHFGSSGGSKVWGSVMIEQSKSFDIGGSTKLYYSSQTINNLVTRWPSAFKYPAAILAWKELML